MAPTKEKKEKLTAGEGADLILDYLKKQNRPYSAADISSNLLNRVSKTHTQKYLKELEEQNRIASRAAGKQIVYHTIQTPPTSSKSSSSSKEDLEHLASNIELLRTKTTTLKSTEKVLRSELAFLASIRTFDEIQSTVQALSTQKQGLIEHLSELKSSAVDLKPINETERAKIEADLTKWKRQVKLRKTAVKELWYIMKDTPKSDPPMKDAEFWEFLGCEGPIP